ncbi:GrpB family protein [Paenibacillus sp. NAIST15-1]|uniref:GrpB family protein n=1 Tax=Paenibacillus sp. NAIST15-1 TaxID=1605994 RepID=UPI00086ABF77|nr:GrpB family protein [Paenibacillus sp. NAIST15-1]GAV11854.1 hypothetical protein PBN151_1783 [Paenibacillus sp. NAIST15-1]
MGLRPVIIEDYNDAWPVMFNELKNILGNKLGELALTIEHVGSTSVPGLSAKPILDIDIVIDSMTLLPQVIGKLSELGYFHEGNLGVENREAFARTDDIVPHNEEMNQKPKHHLYVCNKESDALQKHITFRDILRQQPDLVAAYSSLKKELAERFTNNRTAYTDGKTHFVNTVLDKYKSIL